MGTERSLARSGSESVFTIRPVSLFSVSSSSSLSPQSASAASNATRVPDCATGGISPNCTNTRLGALPTWSLPAVVPWGGCTGHRTLLDPITYPEYIRSWHDPVYWFLVHIILASGSVVPMKVNGRRVSRMAVGYMWEIEPGRGQEDIGG